MRAFAFVLAALLAACRAEGDALWSDLPLTEYQPLPSLEELDYATVAPAREPTYWELREVRPDEIRVLYTRGELCSAVEPAKFDACVAAFAQLDPRVGFGGRRDGVSPDRSYAIVLDQAGSLRSITSSDDLLAFLGIIESPVEAALRALSLGYRWPEGKGRVEDGAYRVVERGFELLVSQWDEAREPCPMQRVLLSVRRSGESRALRRQDLVCK